VVSLDLGDDLSMDGVTSGADPTLWEPIGVVDERREPDQR
jgi:hypothetical protein